MSIELDHPPTHTYRTNAVTGKQEPWRDGNGAYRFTRHDTGELRSYTRASTIADTLEEKLMLHRWELRMLARGLGLRPDLHKLAAGHDPTQDRNTYDGEDGIVNKALATAKTDEAANEGTALHRFTELHDLGATNPNEYPEDTQPHIRSYAHTLTTSGFTVIPEHIEQIIVNDDYRIGGQIDRILTATRPITAELPDGTTIDIPTGTRIVGDLKTGKIAPYKYIEFAIQISIYANHTATWHVDHDHPHGGTRGPRIDVNRDVALIIHLPATDPDAPCGLHWVDLRKGYDYFLEAMTVRALRAAKEKRQLIGPYTPTAQIVPAPVSDHTIALLEWTKQRVQTVVECGNPSAMTALQLQWPIRDDHGHFTPLPDYPTVNQIDAVATVLDRVEADYQLPFTARPKDSTQKTNQLAKVLHLSETQTNGNPKGN